MRKVCFLMAMLLFCASAYAVPEGYTPAGDGKNCYFSCFLWSKSAVWNNFIRIVNG